MVTTMADFPPNPEDGELWLPSEIIHEITSANVTVSPPKHTLLPHHHHHPPVHPNFKVKYLIPTFTFSFTVFYGDLITFLAHKIVDLLWFFWCSPWTCSESSTLFLLQPNYTRCTGESEYSFLFSKTRNTSLVEIFLKREKYLLLYMIS